MEQENSVQKPSGSTGTSSQKRALPVRYISLALLLLALILLLCIPIVRDRMFLLKGDCELMSGLQQSAVNDYQSACYACPDDEAALNKCARLLEDQGRLDKAISCYTKLLSLASNSARVSALSQLTRIHLARKEWDDALQLSNQWIALEPANAMAYREKGSALTGMRKFDDAVDALDKSVQLNPSADAIADRDMVMEKTRTLNTVADGILTNPKLEKNDKSYDALLRDAVRLTLAELQDQAIECATKAIKLQPKTPGAYLLRGWSYFYLRKFPAALADMTAAEHLANGQTIWVPHIATGQILPPHTEPNELQFFKASVCYEARDYNGAITFLNRAIAIRTSSKYYEWRSKAYQALGNKEQARLDNAEALRLGPKTERNDILKDPLNTLLSD